MRKRRGEIWAADDWDMERKGPKAVTVMEK